MDKISPEKRSKIMKAIRSRDTRPELLVRRALTAMGYRYRLHAKDIPGKPDISFKGRKKAIFVHGCFWHGHSCQGGRVPESDFWKNKLAANTARDQATYRKLDGLGWDVLIIWECELVDYPAISSRLLQFLGPARQHLHLASQS